VSCVARAQLHPLIVSGTRKQHRFRMPCHNERVIERLKDSVNGPCGNNLPDARTFQTISERLLVCTVYALRTHGPSPDGLSPGRGAHPAGPLDVRHEGAPPWRHAAALPVQAMPPRDRKTPSARQPLAPPSLRLGTACPRRGGRLCSAAPEISRKCPARRGGRRGGSYAVTAGASSDAWRGFPGAAGISPTR
jgi:hypothetical protein